MTSTRAAKSATSCTNVTTGPPSAHHRRHAVSGGVRRIIRLVTPLPNVVALTGAIRNELPTSCTHCVFWQTITSTTDVRRKDRWVRAFEDRHGAWGRALFDGDAFLGLLQYGPASAFPRARALAAGPPNPDGVLLTCAYLAEGDPTAALERLLLEALADAKARSFTTVDAFAIGTDDAPLDDGQLIGHHTLFHRPALMRMGFREERSRGPVALMRLALRGLQDVDKPAHTLAVAPHTAPARG